MKRLMPVMFLILTVVTSLAQQKQVCITLDDLPLVTYGIEDTVYQQDLMNKIISSLKSNQVPAIGFVNEIKLYQNDQLIPFQIQLLQQWVDSGLALGNHSYSHPDFNALTAKQFEEDIMKGETVTRALLQRKNISLKYFRHPYLHTGQTKEKNDSLNLFLEHHGYVVAPVTIDNDEYLFALAYKRAAYRKDTKLMKQIGADYVLYMEKKVLYFEKQAQAIFGRNINQILLLHANAINGDYLDELAAMFQKNNYTFITLEQALKDEAYKTPVTVYGKWGISWLDRWALSQGKTRDFFKDDPATPEYIKQLTQ